MFCIYSPPIAFIAKLKALSLAFYFLTAFKGAVFINKYLSFLSKKKRRLRPVVFRATSRRGISIKSFILTFLYRLKSAILLKKFPSLALKFGLLIWRFGSSAQFRFSFVRAARFSYMSTTY